MNEDSFHGKYKLGEILGEGNFGQVREAKPRSKSSKVIKAVKIIDLRATESSKTGGIDEGKREEARIETEAMKLVAGHPHCVEFSQAFSDQSLFYIVMEKCQASLMDRLERMARASEDYVANLFREMLLGIAYVHKMNIVHRDIKPNNFLLGGADGDTVKLTDFGMARKMPERGYLTSHCGTAPYMSPEVVGRKPYGFNTDVWSMGVTAYVLLYGDFPYQPKCPTSQAMKDQILLGEPAPAFASTVPDAPVPSERARAFVRELMAREKTVRCSAEEALKLPFVCPGVPPAPDQAGDLTPSFKSARRKALIFVNSPLSPADPTEKRGLDDLLRMLQRKASTFFSETHRGGSAPVFTDFHRQTSGSAQVTSIAVRRRSHSSQAAFPEDIAMKDVRGSEETSSTILSGAPTAASSGAGSEVSGDSDDEGPLLTMVF